MTVSAFTDDALGDHDAVALAELVRTGQVSPDELIEAVRSRVAAVDGELHGLQVPLFDRPRQNGNKDAALYGVPTFLKDNTDLAGVPTNHGSEAFTARPAKADGAYTTQFLSTGLTIVGKTRMPEFGFNATTEYMTEEPVRNPWELGHSVGASSGGSAAFVAAGVVPIAHANDGGGSIRIPAAAAGLVGLKPTRGRHVDGEQARHLPINMISEGVVTRSVRDSAAFLAASEDHWRSPHLPPVGLVRGPAERRLRVGVVLDTVTGALVDDDTRAAVEATASLLEKAGHIVEPMQLPVTRQFADDFVQYWALLADLSTSLGRMLYDRGFDAKRTDGLTAGAAQLPPTPPATDHPAIRRLKRRTERCMRRRSPVASSSSVRRSRAARPSSAGSVRACRTTSSWTGSSTTSPTRRSRTSPGRRRSRCRRPDEGRPPGRGHAVGRARRRAHPARGGVRHRGRPPLPPHPGLGDQLRILVARRPKSAVDQQGWLRCRC